jgi:hypothetical protein
MRAITWCILSIAAAGAASCATGLTDDSFEDDDRGVGATGSGGGSASGANVSSSAAATVGSSGSGAEGGGTSAGGSGSGGGNCTTTNILNDGGFETGPNGGTWTEYSVYYGTPICGAACVAPGAPYAPAQGAYWVWFGGVDPFDASFDPELGQVRQVVTIPVGATATVEFKLQMPNCDSVYDYVAFGFDTTAVFLADGTNAACGGTTYVQHSYNVSAFADGVAHELIFEGYQESWEGAISNFFVDDVKLNVCQ